MNEIAEIKLDYGGESQTWCSSKQPAEGGSATFLWTPQGQFSQRALSDMGENHAKDVLTVKQWMIRDPVFELPPSPLSSKDWEEGAMPSAVFKTDEGWMHII